MGNEPRVRLFDLVMSLSSAMDLVSPVLYNHHNHVAYIAHTLGAEVGLTAGEQNQLLLAGAVHDCGALSLGERIKCLDFELDNPYKHAELGYLMLKNFKLLSNAAGIVRYHHVLWENGRGSGFNGEEVPVYSHILHLADRIDVLIDSKQGILNQRKSILEKIKSQSGRMFMPALVNAFESAAARENFWLDIASESIRSVLERSAKQETFELDLDLIVDLSKLFQQIIDFRSRFTMTHSSGVAASAEALARLDGFSEQDSRMIRIAGHLHDLGKLVVPAEVLEKPEKLTEDEYNNIKSHAFYTYRILQHISNLDTINTWGAFHHERMDGKGYPFHMKGSALPKGARIMAVADVFTAISEDRPYRLGMTGKEAVQTLQKMAADSALDPGVVSSLKSHFNDINDSRISAQKESSAEYRGCLHPQEL